MFKMSMAQQNLHDSSKKVKNIAAIVYLLVLGFLVGGSYLDQHSADAATSQDQQPTPP